jgi:hypothetical protein
MEKWADYLISAVKYNDPKTHIIAVKAYPDLGDKLGTEEHLSRQQVVQGIKSGTTYMTIFKGNNGWQKGQLVEVVVINRQEFIKTIKDNTERDNLDKLPEF